MLLTACGASPSEKADAPGKADGYPVTLKNCGRTVTVDAPPRRAVSVDQGTTEILLSLGLQDRIAATATWTDPVMKGLEKANAGVKRIADNRPSSEKVLDQEPDFVTADFESTLAKGGVAPREQFEKLGVPTYVSPADCTAKDNTKDGDGVRTGALTMDSVYDEVRDLARVFGVPERGEKLVASLRTRISKATDGIDASGTSVLYWFANSESPYLAGCCGAPGIITRELGVKNAFDDTHDEWPQINWETVADRDPDVLVIGDLTRKSQTAESAAGKIAFLESNPVTKKMDAVRHKRYVLLSGQAMNPTIRTVEGLEQLAAGLREFGLAG
ncbi:MULTISPECIES: ABC transporter substrate-binding protein [unclassified Streptomyces]|uniref:ABC transporter substrate-binding protein n=1 Tax=unclassified Streptomyces TaxID=2593676 RepID=UPI002ED3D25F|nr:ABC transporter substrate-binding protein [Streptomyces sp. NBC_00891]WSY09667.1 ABC transporter substrate-binding protein [Streptomyces sp. NBC_00890]WSZ11288.1 ABC transporter substrate-binding protein [Streptomyces sp. NBC_00869]WSZ27724.1 ABC transporter substrate-binding protein [Streptomyces sp. NBC_00870]